MERPNYRSSFDMFDVRTKSQMKASIRGWPDILLITPHVERTVVELRQLLEGRHLVAIDCSNPIKVQGGKRRLIDQIRYYWLDPLCTMCRLMPRVWRYRVIIAYYHRNGYWLGLLRRLFHGSPGAKWIWIGFAPNPPRPGLLGWIKERVTYHALLGHDLIVCNSLPVIDMIRRRYPAVAGRLAYARWGGSGSESIAGSVDKGYVFCGGRTNRDFATVLRVVSELGCPAVFVVGKDAELPSTVPDNVAIYRDVSSEDFQRLVREARVVVLALKRPDISSGQVVLNRAMQTGKPIVVTATAGIDDYVTDGQDAVLAAAGNVEDLKAKLASLLQDPDRRREMGIAARLTYETNFNSRVFAQQLFDALTPVCKSALSERDETS
ncbi:MAG: glycosyltransferase family 4 protein [Gammaproteobacteria bacterium]